MCWGFVLMTGAKKAPSTGSADGAKKVRDYTLSQLDFIPPRGSVFAVHKVTADLAGKMPRDKLLRCAPTVRSKHGEGGRLHRMSRSVLGRERGVNPEPLPAKLHLLHGKFTIVTKGGTRIIRT